MGKLINRQYKLSHQQASKRKEGEELMEICQDLKNEKRTTCYKMQYKTTIIELTLAKFNWEDKKRNYRKTHEGASDFK